MRGATLSPPQYAFMAWCSVKKKHGDNFTFTASKPGLGPTQPKNDWSYTSNPQYACMAWSLVKTKSTGITLPFTFTLTFFFVVKNVGLLF
jgi:hypothetical protein